MSERANILAAWLDEHNIEVTDEQWIMFRMELNSQLDQVWVEAYTKGFAYCREMAAKIVEEGTVGGWTYFLPALAKEISALTPPTKEIGSE